MLHWLGKLLYFAGLKLMGEKYRHYKGGEYLYLFHAKLEEDEDDVVVYRSLKDGRIWVRRARLFFGQVFHQGRSVYRFERIYD